jgi:hypothetical protein
MDPKILSNLSDRDLEEKWVEIQRLLAETGFEIHFLRRFGEGRDTRRRVLHNMIVYANTALEARAEERESALKKPRVPTSDPHSHKDISTLCILRAFRWFLGHMQRDDVERTLNDLKKDIREMRKEGRGRLFINAVVVWQSVRSFTGIVWGGVVRVVSKVLPLARFFSRRD